jgi:broad specificity phosphatase PhoE
MSAATCRTRLILVRHGATAWTESGRYQGGTSDVPLSPKGRWQAECLAAALAPLNLAGIVCSPLCRASETAAKIAASHGLIPAADPAFTEVALGHWEGLTHTEATMCAPDLHPRWQRNPAEVRPPGGETLEEAAARSIPAFEAIVSRHLGATVALIGHSLVTRVLLCFALGAGLNAVGRMRCQPGSMAVVDVRGEHYAVRMLNDTCHLRRERT